ncbi:hypothetical protein [Robbsia sp. KACC 23696]|uniref:hypothetical protein n=1 Tax=Robbsia sp. KACC 23696 TaxID=3149231 RepID=UPI00325B06C8
MHPQPLTMAYPSDRTSQGTDKQRRIARNESDDDDRGTFGRNSRSPLGLPSAWPIASAVPSRTIITGFVRDDDPTFEEVPLDDDGDTTPQVGAVRRLFDAHASTAFAAFAAGAHYLPPTFWGDTDSRTSSISSRDSDVFVTAPTSPDGSPPPSPAVSPSPSRASSPSGAINRPEPSDDNAIVPITLSNRNDRAGDIDLLLAGTVAETPDFITDDQVLAATRGDWKKWAVKLIPTAINTAMQSALAYAFSAGTQAIASIPKNDSEIDAALQSLNATLLEFDAAEKEQSNQDGSDWGSYLGYVAALTSGVASMIIAYRYLFDGEKKSRRIDGGKYALIATAGALTSAPLLLAPKTAPGIFLSSLFDILVEAIAPSDALPKLDVTGENSGSSRTEAWITAGVSGGLSTIVLLIGVPVGSALGARPWVVIPINASIRTVLDLLKPVAQNRLRQWASKRGKASYVFTEADADMTIHSETLDKLKTLLGLPTSGENSTENAEAGIVSAEKGVLHTRGIYKGLLPSAVIGQIPRNALSLVLNAEASQQLSDGAVLTLRIGAIGGASVLSIAMSAFETQRITAKKINKKAAKTEAETTSASVQTAPADIAEAVARSDVVDREPVFDERL